MTEKQEVVPEDLTKLAMTNDYHELAKSTARPTDMPVRKPSRKQYFRVHPKPDWRGAFAVYSDEESNDAQYLVAANVYDGDPEFAEKTDPVVLFFCMYRSGSPFLWPAKRPQGGQGDTWHNSGLAVGDRAMADWVMMTSDRQAGCYVFDVPEARIADPEWPRQYTFNDALRWAFKDRIIVDPNHSVIRRQKGLE